METTPHTKTVCLGECLKGTFSFNPSHGGFNSTINHGTIAIATTRRAIHANIGPSGLCLRGHRRIGSVLSAENERKDFHSPVDAKTLKSIQEQSTSMEQEKGKKVQGVVPPYLPEWDIISYPKKFKPLPLQ